MHLEVFEPKIENEFVKNFDILKIGVVYIDTNYSFKYSIINKRIVDYEI